jgi:hypothetical protein
VTLLALAHVAGALTMISPRIPTLRLFARVDQPFVRSRLPSLLGRAVTFAFVDRTRTLHPGSLIKCNSDLAQQVLLRVTVFDSEGRHLRDPARE